MTNIKFLNFLFNNLKHSIKRISSFLWVLKNVIIKCFANFFFKEKIFLSLKFNLLLKNLILLPHSTFCTPSSSNLFLDISSCVVQELTLRNTCLVKKLKVFHQKKDLLDILALRIVNLRLFLSNSLMMFGQISDSMKIVKSGFQCLINFLIKNPISIGK